MSDPMPTGKTRWDYRRNSFFGGGVSVVLQIEVEGNYPCTYPYWITCDGKWWRDAKPSEYGMFNLSLRTKDEQV